MERRHAAGLLGGNRDPRDAVTPRVPDEVLTYLLYLLRDLSFDGTVIANPYLASLGVAGSVVDERFNALSSIDFRRIGSTFEIKLQATGWVTCSLSLHKLLLRRLRGHGDDVLARMISAERSAAAIAPERGINYLRDKLRRELDGPSGIAADVSREIAAFADANPDKTEQMVVFLGRLGALYPFFRVSALLKHLDGNTRNIPAIVLYPITAEIEKGRSELPASSWISGFYGSGKSSFAKLLGLALDGVVLPEKPNRRTRSPD